LVPIKVYRPCPRFKGSYKQKGQRGEAFFDADANQINKDEMLTVPSTWRSLTKISLRQYPDIESEKTGEAVLPYESFKVEDVIRRNGQHFLKIAGKSGWAFDRGLSGNFAGRPIAERLES